MRKRQFGLQGSKLKQHLLNQGYSVVICVPYMGWCVLEKMYDHTALKYTCDQCGNKGHYRYRDYAAACLSLMTWDGVRDPVGPWFEKHEGRVITENPLYPDYVRNHVEYLKFPKDGEQ